MAANLSLAAANVTDDDGQPIGKRDEPVMIRNNVLRIGAGDAAQAFPNVSTVTNPGRGIWTVRFVDSTEFTVRRGNAGCYSCGG
jgi:hypothetical protein